jgi:hypothetical protein
LSESTTRDSTVVDADPARPVASDRAESRAERARRSGYRSRFALVYILLAIVVGGAVGSFVVLMGKPEAAPAPKWSDWQPTGSVDARLKQIADHVSRRYKTSSGNELAIALVSPPQVTSPGEAGSPAVSVPVSAIAIRPDTSRGQAEDDDIDVVRGGDNSIMFILCGLGQGCSISEGAPSEARHALLRREALELSLYTFKHVEGIDTVTVFLPPRPDGQAPATAVFLKKSDVRDQLGSPLPRTLSPLVPGIGELDGKELAAVNRLTRPRLYSYEYTQAQDGSAVLILTPVVLST